MNKNYQKFMGMFEETLREEAFKVDYPVETSDLTVNSDGTLTVNNVGTFGLEFNAFSQLFQRMVTIGDGETVRQTKMPVVHYLWNEQDTGIMQYAMERHLEKEGNQNWIMRTYGKSVRAFLSDTYSVINNSHVMANVIQTINNHNLVSDDFRVLDESNLGRDSFKIKLLFKNQNNGEYGSGLYFANNELGFGSISFHSLVKRTVCDNSIVSADNLSLYHRGDVLGRLSGIEDDLVRSLEHSSILFKNLHRSRDFPIPNMDNVLEHLQGRYNFTVDFMENVKKGTEGEHNVFGIVNGITYAAQFTDERERYEQIAGKILGTYVN